MAYKKKPYKPSKQDMLQLINMIDINDQSGEVESLREKATKAKCRAEDFLTTNKTYRRLVQQSSDASTLRDKRAIEIRKSREKAKITALNMLRLNGVTPKLIALIKDL